MTHTLVKTKSGIYICTDASCGRGMRQQMATIGTRRCASIYADADAVCGPDTDAAN